MGPVRGAGRRRGVSGGAPDGARSRSTETPAPATPLVRRGAGLERVQRTLALQAAAGNRAVGVVVQRDAVDDWPGAVAHETEAQLQSLTFVVEKVAAARERKDIGLELYWLGQAVDALDELDQHRVAAAAAARAALRSDAETRRYWLDVLKMREGESVVNEFGAFTTMVGQSGRYARRDVSGRGTGNVPGGFLAGLSESRRDGGQLRERAIQNMEREKTAELEAMRKEFQKAGVHDPSISKREAHEALQAFDSDLLSGGTYEARQYGVYGFGKTINEPAMEVTDSVDLHGSTVAVTHDASDGLYEFRLGALEKAVGLVAGVLTGPLPGFSVYMPKFSMTVSRVKGDILVHEIGNRAEFFFPDTLVLTLGAMDAKVGTSVSFEEYRRAQALGKYEAARGIATIVHELGHLFHYKLDRGAFLGLHLAEIKGFTPEGKRRRVEVNDLVSAYGAANPRETVAEILTGIVFGRRYDAQIMAMYDAFGGPAIQPGRRNAPVPGAARPDPSAVADLEGGVAGLSAGPDDGVHLHVTGLSRDQRHELRDLVPRDSPHFRWDRRAGSVEILLTYQQLREFYPDFQRALTRLTGHADELTGLPKDDARLRERRLVLDAYSTAAATKARGKARRSLAEAADEVARDFDFPGYEQMFRGRTLETAGLAARRMTAEDFVGWVFGDLAHGGMVLAEEHGDPAQKQWLTANLGRLKQRGVNTLYVEHFRAGEHQAYLDRFLAGQEPAELATFVRQLDGNVDQGPMRRLLLAARSHGMRVVAADHAAATRRVAGNAPLADRARRMNAVATAIIDADLALHPATRYVYLVGQAHAETHAHPGGQDTPSVSQLLGVPAMRTEEGGARVTLVTGRRREVPGD